MDCGVQAVDKVKQGLMDGGVERVENLAHFEHKITLFNMG